MTLSSGSGPLQADPDPREMTMTDGFDFSATGCLPGVIGAQGGRA